MSCIFTDIEPDAVKIGMVSNVEIMKVIAEKLIQYHVKNIVIDPVMVSTSGSKLISDEATNALTRMLLPLGAVITPNISEAKVLCGFPIANEKDMIKAGLLISEKTGGAVLVKGGHLVSDAVDVLCENGNSHWYVSERIDNPNTHGTGCTLSTAIACNLADGTDLNQSIQFAKEYLTGALRAQLDLGKGSGPLEHTYWL